jgi:SET domain-containing protein
MAIGSIWTMSNCATSSIWYDQAAIKLNSLPHSQKCVSKYYSFIKIHSIKMKYARMPSLLYGFTKATPLADCVEPFRYKWYNRTEHLFKIIIIIITIEGTGIISKHYNIRKFTDCYGKILNSCVKKQRT